MSRLRRTLSIFRLRDGMSDAEMAEKFQTIAQSTRRFDLSFRAQNTLASLRVKTPRDIFGESWGRQFRHQDSGVTYRKRDGTDRTLVHTHLWAWNRIEVRFTRRFPMTRAEFSEWNSSSFAMQSQALDHRI